MFYTILAVGLGSALGGICRWVLSIYLNTYSQIIAWGTLSANLIGCYLIGLLVGFLTYYVDLPNELKPFLITGFLGGLTTFSTFSLEVVNLLQQGKIYWALLLISIHVFGSLCMTALGFWTFYLYKNTL